MTKPLLLLCAGGALFAGGYWTARMQQPGTQSSGDGPVTAALSRVKSGTQTSDSKTVMQAAAATAFTPGRPFNKGEAKAWLLSMAAGLEGVMDNPTGLIDAVQAFLTMDEAASLEVAAALKELAALHDAKDPEVRAIFKGDDLLEGGAMLSMMRLAQLNPEAALAMLKESPRRSDREAMMLVFGRMAAKDPLRAEQAALSFPQDQRNEALKSILHTIAGKNPAAALAFADKYPEAIDRSDRMRLLEKWAQREPLEAMPEAIKFMDKTKDPEMLRQPFDEWYERDAAAAAVWAAAQQGDAKVTTQALMIQKRAMEDPQGAMAAYAELQTEASDPRQLQRLAGTIATALASQGVTAARDWAMTLPPGEPHDAAVYQVAEKWVKDDAPAASEWIRTLPPGNSRDSATVRLIESIRRREPASALEWAQNMQNEQQREQQTRRVLDDWQEQDPEAAQAARAALLEAAKPQ